MATADSEKTNGLGDNPLNFSRNRPFSATLSHDVLTMITCLAHKGHQIDHASMNWAT
jgi:hypothetical protein